MARETWIQHREESEVELQVVSNDKISSSAHQRGESLGTACSGDTRSTSLNLGAMSFIVGLSLASGWRQSFTTSQITSSSSSLKDSSEGSIRFLMFCLSFKCSTAWKVYQDLSSKGHTGAMEVHLKVLGRVETYPVGNVALFFRVW